MLYIISLSGFISSLVLLKTLTRTLPSIWFVTFIFLFGISLFIFIDWFVTFLEDKQDYTNSKKQKRNLLSIEKEKKDKLILLSNDVSKEDHYSLLFTITILITIPILLTHYYIKNVWVIEDLFILVIGFSILLFTLKLSDIANKKTKLIIDKKKGILIIKASIKNSTKYIPISNITKIIIRNLSEQNKDSEFYSILYEIHIQYKGEDADEETKLIELSQKTEWIKSITSKLAYYLSVPILDLSELNLSFQPLYNKDTKLSSNKENDAECIIYSNLRYSKNTNSFVWSNKEANSVLLFEFSLFVLCLASIIYNLYSFALDQILNTVIILFGVITLLIVFSIKSYFSKESFTFTDDNVIYKEILFGKTIKEKQLENTEIKNALFLFSNVILEGKNNYLIGNLSSLTWTEKSWLKKKWLAILNK